MFLALIFVADMLETFFEIRLDTALLASNCMAWLLFDKQQLGFTTSCLSISPSACLATRSEPECNNEKSALDPKEHVHVDGSIETEYPLP